MTGFREIGLRDFSNGISDNQEMRWLVAVLAVSLLGLGCSFERGQGPRVFDDAPAGDGKAGDGSTSMGDAASAGMDGSTDAPPNQVTCPGSMCGTVCCQTCVDVVLSVCTGKVWECDGPEDCANNEVCCNDQNGSSCATTCNGSGRFEVCHNASDCSFACGDCSFRADYGQKVCCE